MVCVALLHVLLPRETLIANKASGLVSRLVYLSEFLQLQYCYHAGKEYAQGERRKHEEADRTAWYELHSKAFFPAAIGEIKRFAYPKVLFVYAGEVKRHNVC